MASLWVYQQDFSKIDTSKVPIEHKMLIFEKTGEMEINQYLHFIGYLCLVSTEGFKNLSLLILLQIFLYQVVLQLLLFRFNFLLFHGGTWDGTGSI